MFIQTGVLIALWPTWKAGIGAQLILLEGEALSYTALIDGELLIGAAALSIYDA